MRTWLLWATSGAVLGAVAAIFVVMAAAAGHGTYLPAALLFPFTMLLALGLDTISPPLVALALAQFPIYGVILAKLRGSPQAQQYVLATHVISATIAGIAVAASDSFG